MKNIIIFIALIMIILLNPAFADNAPTYLYALLNKTDNNGNLALFIEKINTSTDRIESEIKVNAIYDNLFISPNGDLLLSDCRDDISYLNRVDIIRNNSNKIEKYIRTKGAGPMQGYFIDNKLYLLMLSSYRGNPQGAGFEVYDIGKNKPQYQKKIYFGKSSIAYSPAVTISSDRKYFYVLMDKDIGIHANSSIIKIGIVSGEINSEMNISNRLGNACAIIALPNNKLYLYGYKEKAGSRSQKLAENILSYFGSNLEYIKAIKSGPAIFRFINDPDSNGIIAFRRDRSEYPYIDIYDIKQDKLLKKVKVGHIWDAVYAGHNKVYATEMGNDPGLLIIDLTTNKVSKKYPGSFTHLSFYQ